MPYYGGGGGGVSPSGNTDFTGNISVLDGSKFSIKNQADNTKIIQFSAASITAGNTRTITVPDSNTTLPIASQVLTFAGPTAARTITFTDANQTVMNTSGGQTIQSQTTINYNANDNLVLNGSTGTTRTGVYINNTSGNAYETVLLDGNRGGLSAYCGLAMYNSAVPDTVFGVAAADMGGFTTNGANSNGMLLGTLTNDPIVIGTNDTERVRLTGAGSLSLQRTVTAGGTTGNQTINKMAGTVNFAAGASSITVSNSLVDTNSIIFGVIRTADATATSIKSIVPGASSFTITLNAAATAETSVGFLVTN